MLYRKLLSFLILILLFPHLNKGQSSDISFSSFSWDTTTVQCEHDTSIQLKTGKNMIAYQTYNDKWDGEKDSSLCINLWKKEDNNNIWQVDTQDFNINKPLFIRFTSRESVPEILFENAIYGVNFENFGSGLDTSKNCANEMCSGIIMGIEIPDSIENEKTIRWHNIAYRKTPASEMIYCLPTEKFSNENKIKYAIVKLKFSDKATKQHPLKFNFNIQKQNEVVLLQNSNVEDYRTGEKEFNLGGRSFLLLHENEYPSANNISYLEPNLNPNTSTVDTITFNVSDFSNFVFQPFAQIRAGLVAGSDSIRHVLNFISNGTLCLNGIAEFFLGDGAIFTYKGGTIEFLGKSACLGIGKQSKLVIDDETILQYGKNGKGMLNVKPGGTIEIGRNSELIIGNTFIINEYMNQTTPGQVYMTLNKGSKLTFAKGSRLVNDYSVDHSIKLNIYMEGGVLDLKGLPVKDRKLVNLIYRSDTGAENETLSVHNYPQTQTLYINFKSNLSSNGYVQITDLQGKELNYQKVKIIKGQNNWELPCGDCSNQIILVNLRFNNQSITKKTMKW